VDATDYNVANSSVRSSRSLKATSLFRAQLMSMDTIALRKTISLSTWRSSVLCRQACLDAARELMNTSMRKVRSDQGSLYFMA